MPQLEKKHKKPKIMSNEEKLNKLVDSLTIKLPDEEASPQTDPPVDMIDIPELYDFFTKENLYHRFHINLFGVKESKFLSGAKIKKYNKLGFKDRLDEVGPSVEVETVAKSGLDTGSTDVFPIGKCMFASLKNNKRPVWDKKNLIIGKKDGVDAIKFTMKDGSKVIFEYFVKKEDFPEVGGDWKTFTVTPEAKHKSLKIEGLEFIFRMRVTACTDKHSSKQDLHGLLQDTETITYTEQVIPAAEKRDNALLQIWRHKEPSTKAVLWHIGRNDCFMHPHVVKPMFFDKGYDVYLLNYSMDGMCRKRGWVEQAWFNSHNYTGSFDVYNDQVEAALSTMKESKYDKVLGYAHSTGAPVLLNFLMNKGDDDFDGFIFNSPFLDMMLSNDTVETMFEKLTVAVGKMGLDNFSVNEMLSDLEKHKLYESGMPKIQYMNNKIDISAWSAKIWSQYFFDFRCRTMYSVPQTVGFGQGVISVFNLVSKWQKKNKYITLKPLVLITSRSDDTLDERDTVRVIDSVSPARCELELRHNAHDVFLSTEMENVTMAINMVKVWMDANGFE